MAPTIHPEQPFGGPDGWAGCRTRQHGGSGLKSTTGAYRGTSTPMVHGTDQVAKGGSTFKNE